MSETKIDNLVIEITTDSSAASKNIDKVSNSLKNLNKGTSGNTAKSLRKISTALKSFLMGDTISRAIREINNYIENVNLFTVSMGEFANEAKAYAERIESAMGVDSSEFMRNQAIFKNMATGFGLAEDKAYQLSKGMTELAYDISSFYNTDMETAFQRLQSGLAGEIEPVRRWGIALDQASMKQWLLKNGIDANVNSLTQADKALVRYNMMVEAMANNGAVGDLARTLETPANAIRILKQQITQLYRAIGTLLIPILNKVIPYIQAFVKVLTSAAKAIASFFGINIDFNVDFGGMTSGASGYGDALDDASESAKKLKDYTMGFDELNIINPDTGSSSGSSSSSSGLGLDVASVWDESLIAGIESKTDALAGKMKILAGGVGAVGLAFAAWKISGPLLNALSTVKNTLGTALGYATVPVAANSGIMGLLTFVAKNAVKITVGAAAILLVAAAILDLWKNSEKFRTAVETEFGKIKGAFIAFKTALWDNVVSPVLTNLGITASSFKELYELHIRPIVEKIAIFLVEKFGGAITGVLGFFTLMLNTIGTINSTIATKFSDLKTKLDGIWDQIKTSASTKWGELKTAVSGIVTGFITWVKTQFSNFKTAMSTMWGQIKTNTVTKAKAVWTAVKTWFNESVKACLTVEFWTARFESIGTAFTTTIKNAINLGIGLFNTFITWLNSRMKFSWNDLKIGDKTLVNAGSIQLFTIPLIQPFKDGGFIEDGLFTMNHGEMAGKFSNGQSVVANNQQIVDGIADGVYRAMLAARSDESEKPVQVNVILDGKQISKSVDKYNNSKGRVIMGNGLGYNF